MACCQRSLNKEIKTSAPSITQNILKDNSNKKRAIIVGDSGVGKTCLLVRMTDQKFLTDHRATIGVDYKIKLFSCRNEFTKLQIWDTAGQERFRSITKAFFRNVNLKIIVASFHDDINETMLSVKSWNNNEDYPSDMTLIVLNKIDNARSININNLKVYCFDKNIPFILTSALNEFGMDFLEEAIAECFLGEYKFRSNYQEAERYLKDKIANDQLEVKIKSIQTEIKSLENRIEPQAFKISTELSSQPLLQSYYNTLKDKLDSFMVDADNILTNAKAPKLGLKSQIIISGLNLVPIIGKYMSKGIEIIAMKIKEFELMKYAAELKSCFGQNKESREYVIKKVSERLTLINKDKIFSAETDPEVIYWKNKSVINQIKDFFLNALDCNYFLSDEKILACIHSLKIMVAVMDPEFKNSIPVNNVEEDNEFLIGNIVTSVNYYSFDKNQNVNEIEIIYRPVGNVKMEESKGFLCC